MEATLRDSVEAGHGFGFCPHWVQILSLQLPCSAALGDSRVPSEARCAHLTKGWGPRGIPEQVGEWMGANTWLSLKKEELLSVTR